MRNRWFHTPLLHAPQFMGSKKVTWLELFYDLIFVAAIIQLGNGLSKHVSLSGFLGFAGLFIPLWVAWTGFTFYVNRFNVDDFLHRLLVFAQMFVVGAMAIAAPRVFEGKHHMFALAYGLAQLIVALLYLRAWLQVREGRAYSRYWGSVFAVGSLLWIISLFVSGWLIYALWGIGVSLIFITPLSRQSRALQIEYPIDREHLSERYGLFTIIVLGESFVKVLSSLSAQGVSSWSVVLEASVLLLITCGIWWVYFDDVAGSEIRGEGFSPIVWLYGHLPLQIGITAVGIAVKKAIGFEMGEIAPDAYRWLLSGSLALTFFGVGLVDSVTERRQAELSDRARIAVRMGSACLLLLLAPAGAGMTSGLYLALIAATLVGQVVFDLMMAPFEAVPEMEKAVAGIDVSDGDVPERSIRKDNTASAVRKGTPNALRQDLYFYFMQGGWGRFFGVILFMYIMLNVFFGALYMLKPDCISEVRPDSFADAFFFSVQTMSTIGYGTMSPISTYAHTLVTIEAAISIISVALVTGLMFAKVSQPQAKVLFSEPLLLSTYDGKPALIFRVGNARGNEIVDAGLTVTLVRDEVSSEGEQMRKMVDMKLLRDRTPLFSLSWTVFHVIDEASPLYGLDAKKIETKDMRFLVVTLLGHDGTYGQTVYARHSYYPEDIREGHRFIDIDKELSDGRLLLDYSKFHDTVKA